MRSRRTIKKTGHTSTESRSYLARIQPEEQREAQWLELIRGHWGGVEVRNHWRRDAVMGEDRSRSRHAHLLGDGALIRRALRARRAEEHPGKSRPQRREQLHSRPSRCLTLRNA